jgi:hypothetical protein
MKNILLIAALFISVNLYAQRNLDYYISKSLENAPSLYELQSQIPFNNLQYDFDKAQNSAYQVSLTGNMLFAPYFNNGNSIISTNPNPNAIGYDIGVTNGGLYSVQLNFQKNIFNAKIMDVLKDKNNLSGKSVLKSIELEEHNLKKTITDLYLGCLQYLLMYNLSQGNITNLQEQLKATEQLVSNGFAKTQDLLMLKIEMQNQQMANDELFRNYKSGLLQLNSICGINDTGFIALDTVNLEITKKIDQSNFIAKYSIDSLLNVNQQEFFETKYQPQVNVFLNTGLNAVEFANIQRKLGLSVGVNFSYPIFDGNQKSIMQQQSIISGKTIQQSKHYNENNFLLQRQNEIEKIKSIKTSLNSIQIQIEDYKRIIAFANNQLYNGNMSMLDYLTLLKNSIELERNKINAEINYQLEINNFNYWNW